MISRTFLHLVLGMILGAIVVDQMTLRICKTSGEVQLIGGGSITCAAKDAP